MSGFDLNAMRAALLQCDKNIEVFEAAIRKEIDTKQEYKRIIRQLEELEANPPKFEVEVVRTSNVDMGDEEDA
jgi:hypothetical protein